MKTNCWLILGTMLATSAVAQVNTNKLPEIPAPATVTLTPVTIAAPTNAVAPVTKKKKAAPVVKKKKAVVKKLTEPSATLVAGPATVVSANLNLRGQAGLKGEVVGHLKAGDTVTVISQINLDKHAADEPAQWAKIALPTSSKVWVNSKYVDAATKTVSVKKLNLRAGPGENYSVLGVIEKGAAVTEITNKNDWTQIETPANAFAFAAVMYLKQEPLPVVEPTNPTPAVVEPAVVVTPPPTPNTVVDATPIVTQPAVPPTPAVDTNAAVAVTPAVADTNAVAPVVDVNLPPPPPRVVTHEGSVRSSTSIVAPTPYELYDNVSGNSINFLYSSTTNLDLSRYDGMQIIVTGEEGLSARWGSTPVMTVQKIFVLSSNPPPDFKRVASPRGSEQTIRAKPQQRR